jgi:putative methyltransferase (TIGR04325 family)
VNSLIQDLCPPVLWRVLHRVRDRSPGWTHPLCYGNYANWDDAVRDAGSTWHDAAILQHVRAAVSKARSTETFERDARIGPIQELQWPVVATLNRVAAEQGGHLRVFDFGGSLGSLYQQCRAQLASNVTLRWRIVELPAMAQVGQAEFQTDELMFFDSIEAALKDFTPDLVLASGSPQCLRDPYQTLQELLRLSQYFLLDRIPMINGPDRLTIQNFHPSHYGEHLRIPHWLFNRAHLTNLIAKSHVVLSQFAGLDGTMDLPDGTLISYRGLVAKRR